MSIKREGEYWLSLARPLFPGELRASGLVWDSIDDAATFAAATETSNKFRHVAADKSLSMQSAKTEFMNGIGVGYHSNNNADQKKPCPGGIHKRWASCLNQPLDRNVDVLFLLSVSLSILRAALQCGKLENSSWDYGRIN